MNPKKTPKEIAKIAKKTTDLKNGYLEKGATILHLVHQLSSEAYHDVVRNASAFLIHPESRTPKNKAIREDAVCFLKAARVFSRSERTSNYND